MCAGMRRAEGPPRVIDVYPSQLKTPILIYYEYFHNYRYSMLRREDQSDLRAAPKKKKMEKITTEVTHGI
jgi:hypothetical protein